MSYCKVPMLGSEKTKIFKFPSAQKYKLSTRSVTEQKNLTKYGVIIQTFTQLRTRNLYIITVLFVNWFNQIKS